MAKPHIVLLADVPNWAYDISARSLVEYLSDEFDFTIEYITQYPDLSYDFDLIHVFNWNHKWHGRFVRDGRPVLREVSSFRWREPDFGCLSVRRFVDQCLDDATHILVTSKMMQETLARVVPSIYAPNGVETSLFKYEQPRSGELQIGWAGRAADKCKGLIDILLPAVKDEFNFKIQGGDCPHHEMGKFYNQLDVLCVASTAEGEPLPLIESMACGCFPICTRVGLVPELIKNGENGLIVERNPQAFRAAFEWCRDNIEHVREQGQRNADMIARTRSWKVVSKVWRRIFRQALGLAG